MAPALVEHSAAKERNSISKEYSKIRGCISQFDIDLLDKYSHQYPADSFETKVKGSSLLEMNNSEKKERQKISFANSESMVSLKEVPVISLPKLKNIGSSCDVVKTGYKNGTLNYKLEKVPSSDNSHVYSTKIESTKQDCNNSEDRLPEPVATMDNSSIINYLQNKKESCGLKFFDLNRNMNKLNARLRQLQTKNITSHVSAHVNNKLDSDDVKPSKSNDTKSNKKEISSYTGIQLNKSWEDLKKVHDMVSFKTDDTDCEDDLEVRQRVPVSRSKKKSDNPPPPPDALHQWKIKRAYIGSQCSWLSLKISSLDKKISELDELLQKHKLEKKNSKTDVNIDKSNQSVLDTSEEKNELTHAPEEQICRRVLPYTTHHRHEYVSSHESNSHSYNCRCLPSVASCRLCLHSQKHSVNNTRNERTGKMDWSFHPILSYENDVSLSFLLEETLRRQRINTKVTISKPTKKKKKQKIKECNNELSEKDPTGTKHSTSSKHTSDKNHIRCKGGKGDRLKYDDVPRKRSTGIESGHSGRSRKQRKLSESEESWKPSTPTELNSPFSHNISSNTFFPIKQRKKNSSGGDYDINNIVIPYSMAAATRVERIQYKEIPTPGWRNIGSAFNGHDVEIEHCELTDDEVYLDRHSRCEVNEKKKFTDYFQPAIRRRPYHLSESTASGPPSPLISDDVVRQNINTPIDSPIINSAATTNSRIVNVTLIPEEEREPCWPLRTYPLCPSDCKNLRNNNNPSTSSSSSTTTTNDTISTSPTFSNADSSKYAIPSKYSDCSTTVVSALMDCPRGTITPSYTPTQTPMPSPLCSPGGTPSDMDGSENSGNNGNNPDSWTVKVMNEPKCVVTTADTAETQQQQQQQPRTGIVLKLAKK